MLPDRLLGCILFDFNRSCSKSYGVHLVDDFITSIIKLFFPLLRWIEKDGCEKRRGGGGGGGGGVEERERETLNNASLKKWTSIVQIDRDGNKLRAELICVPTNGKTKTPGRLAMSVSTAFSHSVTAVKNSIT